MENENIEPIEIDDAPKDMAENIDRLIAVIIDGLIIMVLIAPLMYLTGYFEGVSQGQVPSLAHQPCLCGAATRCIFFD